MHNKAQLLVRVFRRSLRRLTYAPPAEALPQVWMAVRASLRNVLETVTIADLVAGSLPADVDAMAAQYQTETEARHS